MKRDFHIGDILSVTTGLLMSPRRIGGVYDILNYMTRDNLFTHQLPRACDECRPFLLKQYPDLETVDVSGIASGNFEAELAKIVARYGETRPVDQIPREAHPRIDPVTELHQMLAENK